MPAILIIAYGNPLRRDDGVAWLIAETLRPEYPDSAVSILTEHQVLPEMAAAISEASSVFFVDAGVTLPPGVWREDSLSPETDGSLSSLTHHLTPGQLLTMSSLLYGSLPAAWMITIGAEDFALGEGLSSAVQSAHAAVCDHLRGRIRALLDTPV